MDGLRDVCAATLADGRFPADHGDANGDAYAERAGRMVGMAAETFNDGLRAYYMAFAALMWFSSVLALALATAGIVPTVPARVPVGRARGPGRLTPDQ
ncbi:MAG: DUF599 family protein [Burkholderiaceae bacterium]